MDVLAESARNRGLRLVRSRVRTPGKRRFGKVGLTDTSGKPVFGMDAKGPTAKPEEVEAHLRSLGAKDWGASLDGAEPQPTPKGRPAQKRAKAAAAERKPVQPHKPQPKPVPQVRDARPGDAARLVELIRYLGHEIDEPAVRRNLALLRKAGESPLVATLGKEVVGLCGLHRTLTPHRDAPLGRITILVVAAEAQGQGIGRVLLDAAEAWMRGIGCKMVEVTSNDRRAEAHAFYRHMGFERTSIRFAKTL
jgi:N-acetylglutamate synthase-like GNAT family acetyltransferase